MKDIKRSKIKSNNSDCYTALAILFSQVSVMAVNKIGGWELVESATYCDEGYYLTVFSNGKLTVKAESKNGDHTCSVYQNKANNDE